MDNKHPRVGVGVFIFKDGKFLMGCRKSSHGAGSWSVPGGHLEFGESIEQCSTREVLEETGVKIKNIQIVGITNDIFKEEGRHYITIWVTSQWKSGKVTMIEPDKFLDLSWHTFEDLPKKLFLPWTQLKKSEFIKDIKKELAKTKK